MTNCQSGPREISSAFHGAGTESKKLKRRPF